MKTMTKTLTTRAQALGYVLQPAGWLANADENWVLVKNGQCAAFDTLQAVETKLTSVERERRPNGWVDHQAVADRLRQGLSSARIGRELGISAARVIQIRALLDMPKGVDMKRAAVKRLFGQGLSDEQIAASLGTTVFAVQFDRRKLGLSRQQAHRQRCELLTSIIEKGFTLQDIAGASAGVAVYSDPNLEAMRAIRGEVLAQKKAAKKELKRANRRWLSSIKKRRAKVDKLLAEGLSYDQIAARLKIKRETVRSDGCIGRAKAKAS